MDFNNSKKITILVVALLVVSIGVFLADDKEDVREEEEILSEEFNGNLIINNPGLDEGWHLSYEEEGSPGLTKKLILEEENVNCVGDLTTCTDFFQMEEDLAGREVIVWGESKEDGMQVEKVDFKSEKSECNFDFDDFKTEEVNLKDYKIDFDTAPDALNFETKIRESVNNGPNFAGKYAYAGWGCGTNCESAAIVNLETGEIVEYGLINSLGAKHREDSRLLILNPRQEDEFSESDSVFSEVKSKYFLMEKDQLLLLCEE